MGVAGRRGGTTDLCPWRKNPRAPPLLRFDDELRHERKRDGQSDREIMQFVLCKHNMLTAITRSSADADNAIDAFRLGLGFKVRVRVRIRDR